MNTQIQTGAKAKDFFINLGAVIALYTLVFSLLNLLFTVINYAYPQVNDSYYYGDFSSSISWPVAVLIIFFPVFLLLMWTMSKYTLRAESGVHKWLTYVTLFLSGLTLVIDLVTVLYYFLDGQELTTAFLFKVGAVLLVAGSVFIYFVYDVLGKLSEKARIYWRVFATVLVFGSIVLGFLVMGSPHTQRLYKYDNQKANDLSSIEGAVNNFYQNYHRLPVDLEELAKDTYYISSTLDPNTHKPYEYSVLNSTHYNLCAQFNLASRKTNPNSRPIGVSDYAHGAGRVCFERYVVSDYLK